MKNLTLNLKGVYFYEIQSGYKKFEFRLVKPFWTARIKDREYDQIIIKLGYPRKDETDKIIERPWRGYEKRTITHPEFGPDPVEVYAIRVNNKEQEMSNEDLKDMIAGTCLHCGSKNNTEYLIGEGWKIGCIDCQASSGLRATKTQAIAAWNKRHVCPDKKGKAVYAGDEIKAWFRPTERIDGQELYDVGQLWWDDKMLLWRLAIKGEKHTKKIIGHFYDEIELMESNPPDGS